MRDKILLGIIAAIIVVAIGVGISFVIQVDDTSNVLEVVYSDNSNFLPVSDMSLKVVLIEHYNHTHTITIKNIGEETVEFSSYEIFCDDGSSAGTIIGSPREIDTHQSITVKINDPEEKHFFRGWRYKDNKIIKIEVNRKQIYPIL